MEKHYSQLIISLLLFTTIQSKLTILHPTTLKDSIGKGGQVRASLGNFGHLNYGTSVMGRLHYPDKNQDGCKAFEENDFSSDKLFDEEDDMNPIVMVDRGGCPFVLKVRNIENLGVKLALIADNREEESENLIMADDGSGLSINIPSFLIRKVDADKIKKAWRNAVNSVYLKGEIEMINPDNRVEYELWFSSILDIDRRTIFDLGSHERAFNSSALFTPRILTYTCKDCDSSIIEKNCFSKGEYCVYMPRNPIPKNMEGVTGIQLLTESLRAKCVYQVLRKDVGENSDFFRWFNYMINFEAECQFLDRYNADCANLQLDRLKIDKLKVQDCMDSSFRVSGDIKSDNSLLAEDRLWSRQLGISFHPSITINNITYRGELTGYDVFKTICAGFQVQPEICKGANIFKFIAESQKKRNQFYIRPRHARFSRFAQSLKGVSLYAVIFAVGCVVALNVFLLCMYRKQQRKKMNQELQAQVNSAVSQYFRLAGSDTVSR